MPSNSKRKPKDDEASVVSESKGPVKSVPALMGEGEKFFRDQLYSKAIECYTEALELSPGNKNALVERAACYLKTGKNDLALADAEESLKENREYTKGLFQKAEALYAMGEFELALVFYHRGKKLRGDVKEFQLGINKAQEAIDNCVGDPSTVKLEVKGDLSYFDKPEEKNKKQQKFTGYIKPFSQKQQAAPKREKRVNKTGSQKTIKQLLGELYADKIYLEKLLDDDHVIKPKTRSGDAIWGLANNGLDFLDSRTEFWRQQKPIYARKRSYGANNASTGTSSNKNPSDYILKQLEVIDNLQTNNKHSESLDKANKLMAFTNKQTESQVPDKKAIITQIYSNIGNAYLEMGKYDLALQSHKKDLELSNDGDDKAGISRAYENMGRVYARNGKYKDALQVWEKKLPMAENDMEKAWLYHEIGRCHIELGNYEEARDYGRKSLSYSDKLNDDNDAEKINWQLNAVVLIGQAGAKMNTIDDLNDAIEHFEKAIQMTEKQNDEPAGKAIKKVLNDCREKLRKLQVETPEQEADEPEKTSSPEQQQREPTPQAESRKVSAKSSAHNTPPPPPPPPEAEEPINKDEPEESELEQPKEESEEEDVTKDDLVHYDVTVITANKVGAGTSSQVFLKITGALGSTDKINLAKTTTGGTPFQKGNTDIFNLKTVDVGEITSINISHDGASIGQGWFLDKIEINYKDKPQLNFIASRWLDVDQEDGKIELDLYPEQYE